MSCISPEVGLCPTIHRSQQQSQLARGTWNGHLSLKTELREVVFLHCQSEKEHLTIVHHRQPCGSRSFGIPFHS